MFGDVLVYKLYTPAGRLVLGNLSIKSLVIKEQVEIS